MPINPIKQISATNPTDSIKMNSSEEKLPSLFDCVEQKSNAESLKQTKLIVQNNESIEQIARLVLKSRSGEFDYNEILKEIDNIKMKNIEHLDGTKKGFIVGREIIVDAEIDTSNRQTTDDSKYIYTRATGTKRIKDITEKYNLLNNEPIDNLTYNKAKNIYNKYMEEYGKIDSASLEHLILQGRYKVDPKLGERVMTARGGYLVESDNPKKLEALSKRVKEQKAGNCQEISSLVHKICHESGIKANKLFPFNQETSAGHTAIMINEKNELITWGIFYKNKHEEMLNLSDILKDKIIIDPWLEGVYNANDWVKIVEELYPEIDKIVIDSEMGMYR